MKRKRQRCRSGTATAPAVGKLSAQRLANPAAVEMDPLAGNARLDALTAV
jgi:hypothetical protein